MKADIFALLATPAAATTAATLSVISVWRVATHYLMFFCLHPDQFASHYDGPKKVTFLCSGEACPACKLGHKSTAHIYLPCWDVQNRRIVVLKLDTRPDGPAPKIAEFLALYKDQLATIVSVLKCAGGGAFTLTAHQPTPETDRGSLVCRDFCAALEQNPDILKRCVTQLTEQEILELPSVKQLAPPLVGNVVAPAAATVTPIAVVSPPDDTPVNPPVDSIPSASEA